MTTYRIETNTNGYQASRNINFKRNCTSFVHKYCEEMSLQEAYDKLIELFNDDYRDSHGWSWEDVMNEHPNDARSVGILRSYWHDGYTTRILENEEPTI